MGCCAKYVLICAASAVFRFGWNAVNAGDIREASWIILLKNSRLKKNGYLPSLFNCALQCYKLNFLYVPVLKKKGMHLNMYMCISINAHLFAC